MNNIDVDTVINKVKPRGSKIGKMKDKESLEVMKYY